MSLREKAKEFDSNGEHRREIDKALELLRELRKKYPFKDDAESIDKLTAEDIYTKKKPDCFFKWVQFKLGPLGRITARASAFLSHFPFITCRFIPIKEH